MKAITFGPRLWSSTSAATVAPATVGHAQHRRVTADDQDFTKLHDRADIAGDLANLEYIIRNDAVLPAAGFDDCEHRLIPSCSIPASDRKVRVGFLFSRLWVRVPRAPGVIPWNPRKNKRRRKSRAGWRAYSRLKAASQGKRGRKTAKYEGFGAIFGDAGRSATGVPQAACETNGFHRRCSPAIRQGEGISWLTTLINTTGIAGHGAGRLPSVDIDSFNIELKDEEGFLGDRASKGAFRDILESWRKPLRKAGEDPFGDEPSEEISKKTLDAVLVGDDVEASAVVHSAIEEFAQELAYVTRRFLKTKAWAKTERIVVGGGFRESRLGETCHRAHRDHPEVGRRSRSTWCRSASTPTMPG